MAHRSSLVNAFGLCSRGARLVFRTLGGLITGKKLFGLGGGYAGGLMQIVRTKALPSACRRPSLDLSRGRRGCRRRGHRSRRCGRIRARKGVVLGTGGFARNTEWRLKNHGIEGYTSAPEGDLGTGIQVGIDAGADVALMDDAWWGASIPMPDGTAGSCSERSIRTRSWWTRPAAVRERVGELHRRGPRHPRA